MSSEAYLSSLVSDEVDAFSSSDEIEAAIQRRSQFLPKAMKLTS